MFRAKMTATDINDIAAFFAELVSRSKEFLARPVHIHFVTDFVPGKKRQADDIGDFLPFLRTVLFDAAQNTVPNPQAALSVHTPPAEENAADVFDRIASRVLPDGDDFFVITLGKPGIRKDAAKGFAGLGEEARRRLTLFHIPREKGSSSAVTNALAAAVRILLRGEEIPRGDSGLRILQETN